MTGVALCISASEGLILLNIYHLRPFSVKLQVRVAWQELAVIIDSKNLDLFRFANTVDDSKGLADPFTDAFEVIFRDFTPDVWVNEKPVDQA